MNELRVTLPVPTHVNIISFSRSLLEQEFATRLHVNKGQPNKAHRHVMSAASCFQTLKENVLPEGEGRCTVQYYTRYKLVEHLPDLLKDVACFQ